MCEGGDGGGLCELCERRRGVRVFKRRGRGFGGWGWVCELCGCKLGGGGLCELCEELGGEEGLRGGRGGGGGGGRGGTEGRRRTGKRGGKEGGEKGR